MICCCSLVCQTHKGHFPLTGAKTYIVYTFFSLFDSSTNCILLFVKMVLKAGSSNCQSSLFVPHCIWPIHQWLRQISMKLPFAVLRKSALKFSKGSKRENSISYYFLLFWFNQNSISVLKTLLSCLSEKTLWKVDSESLYKKQDCMKCR